MGKTNLDDTIMYLSHENKCHPIWTLKMNRRKNDFLLYSTVTVHG